MRFMTNDAEYARTHLNAFSSDVVEISASTILGQLVISRDGELLEGRLK